MLCERDAEKIERYSYCPPEEPSDRTARHIDIGGYGDEKGIEAEDREEDIG
ncbi:MAG: hypothetical protein GY749_17020 [Desulfobacteraceae bacterium]|nr:hypothetical protein [Desulfobacteraceae bacterium]